MVLSPSFIYSWSASHISEHSYLLGHLGCEDVNENIFNFAKVSHFWVPFLFLYFHFLIQIRFSLISEGIQIFSHPQISKLVSIDLDWKCIVVWFVFRGLNQIENTNTFWVYSSFTL